MREVAPCVCVGLHRGFVAGGVLLEELHAQDRAGHGPDRRADHGPQHTRIIACATVAFDCRTKVTSDEEPCDGDDHDGERLVARGTTTAGCRSCAARHERSLRGHPAGVVERTWRTTEVHSRSSSPPRRGDKRLPPDRLRAPSRDARDRDRLGPSDGGGPRWTPKSGH